MKHLPNHWSIKKLGNVCKTTSGGTPSRKNKAYFEGDIPWVKSGELLDGPVVDIEECITEEAVKNSSAKIFPPETLLIALYGATVGKLGILKNNATTNQAVCAIFPSKEIATKYLFWFLRYVRSDLISLAVGGAQPNISQGILRELEIPIAPPNQQKQIVAEIEKQFSRLDEAVANLKRIKANLKRYKAAVLKAAVEGRLIGPKTTTWKRIPLDQLGKWCGGGTPSKAKPQFWTGGNIPWVSPKDMKSTVILDTKDHITKEAVSNSATNLIPANSVLVVTRSGILKHTLPIAVSLKEVAINQDLKALQPEDAFDSYYLAMAFRAYEQEILHRCAKMGTTVQNINFLAFKRFEIPVPSLPEQHQIVAEVERRLSVIDELETTVEANLIRSDRLRQSILSQAFSGRLVVQDGKDSTGMEPQAHSLAAESQACYENDTRERR